MRFALRNKTKLIEAKGADFYAMLIESLKAYAAENDQIATTRNEEKERDEFEIINQRDKTQKIVFVITAQNFDVIQVAFFKTI